MGTTGALAQLDSHGDHSHHGTPAKLDPAAVEEGHVQAVRSPPDLLEDLAVVLRQPRRQSLSLSLHLACWAAISVVYRQVLEVRVLRQGQLVCCLIPRAAANAPWN